MKRSVANTVIGLVAVMALLIGLVVNRILTPTTLSHEQLSENGFFAYEVPRRFTEISLIDHQGNEFTRDDFRGQWTLVFFGYTYCPDICPLTLATLSQFSDLLEDTDYAEDTNVAMVSVDPERDTPEKLAQYVSYFNEDYIGLTGEYIHIFNFARQLNVAFSYEPQGEEGDYLVSHSGEIALINPEGDFHGFFKHSPDPGKMLMTYSSVRESF